MLKPAEIYTHTHTHTRIKRCLAFLFSAFLFISPASSTTLPDGYTELEYIESTGTQYIDTGFVYDNNTRVIWDVQLTATLPLSDYQGFGVGYVQNNMERLGFSFEGKDVQKFLLFKAKAGGNPDTRIHTIPLDNNRHVIEVNSPTHKGYVDGVEYTFDSSVGTTDNVTNATLPLFCWYSNIDGIKQYSHYSEAKLYSVKIYDNGTLVRNMVPARNSSGVVGLYDTVNNVFYTNSGTGTFIAGPVVVAPCGSYTELEYIQADVKNAGSDGVPHINTYYYPISNKTRILMDTMFTTISGVSSYNTKPFSAGTYGNDLFQLNFGGYFLIYNYSSTPSPGDYKGSNGVYNFDTRYVLDYNKNIFSVDGTVVKTFAEKDVTVTSNPLIFMQHPNSGANSSMRLYSCKIYEDNTLIRDFIPARNSDGVVGLCDTVNDKFYTNAGTGTFTAGPVVNWQSEYTQLEYIDLDSTYIDTGLYLYTDQSTNHYPNIHYTFMPLRYGTTGNNMISYLGTRSPGLNGGYGLLLGSLHSDSDNFSYIDYFDGTRYYGSSGTGVQLNTKYEYDIVNRSATLKDVTNNTALLSHTFGDSTQTSTKSLTINALNVNGNGITGFSDNKVRIYDFEVEGESHLVPAKRNSDNAVGMYDTIRNIFILPNSGTVTGGPEISAPATITIHWGGLSEPDASGMCVYGGTFTAPSVTPTAAAGYKFLGWRPI